MFAVRSSSLRKKQKFPPFVHTFVDGGSGDISQRTKLSEFRKGGKTQQHAVQAYDVAIA